MAIDNQVFLKIQSALSPIVSIGVGSAIVTICSKLSIDPDNLEDKDLPKIKNELLNHYKQFWEKKITDIEKALNSV